MNKRYHIHIFFPGWAEKSLEEFTAKSSSSRSIVFSLHALEKIIDASFDYGKSLYKYLLKSMKSGMLNSSNIFEFYARGEEVRKACYRISFNEFPVDIVLVLSADGVVITLYTINKGDFHDTLNPNLYERK